MRKVSISILVAAIVFAASCAKDATEDAYYGYHRALQAWINVNCPGASPNDSGVFILESKPGTGLAVGDSSYVFARYYRTDMKGNYAATNIDSLEERLYYRKASYYRGCDIWRMDQGYLPKGLEPVIKGMKEGGEVRLALPIDMSAVTYSAYTAFSQSESDNVIYYVKIERVVNDIYAYQDSVLAAFSKKYYDGMDSLSNGFYFKLKGRMEDADTLVDETSHPLRYMGRRVEDMVMVDTNVRDTARKYDIYSSSATYDTLGVARYADISTMISNAQVIEGFARAVHEMRLGDTVEVFFRSDLGYGAGGSSTIIPEYAPLFFRIYTDPALGKKDLDDEED